MKTYKIVIQGKNHKTGMIETHSFDVETETQGEAMQMAELRVAVGHGHEPVAITKVIELD